MTHHGGSQDRLARLGDSSDQSLRPSERQQKQPRPVPKELLRQALAHTDLRWRGAIPRRQGPTLVSAEWWKHPGPAPLRDWWPSSRRLDWSPRPRHPGWNPRRPNLETPRGQCLQQLRAPAATFVWPPAAPRGQGGHMHAQPGRYMALCPCGRLTFAEQALRGGA